VIYVTYYITAGIYFAMWTQDPFTFKIITLSDSLFLQSVFTTVFYHH